MHSYDSTFHRLLMELIEEQRQQQTRQIIGHLKTFDEYRYRVGLLHGLELVERLCAEVERRLAGSTS